MRIMQAFEHQKNIKGYQVILRHLDLSFSCCTFYSVGQLLNLESAGIPALIQRPGEHFADGHSLRYLPSGYLGGAVLYRSVLPEHRKVVAESKGSEVKDSAAVAVLVT